MGLPVFLLGLSVAIHSSWVDNHSEGVKNGGIIGTILLNIQAIFLLVSNKKTKAMNDMLNRLEKDIFPLKYLLTK